VARKSLTLDDFEVIRHSAMPVVRYCG